MNEQFILEITDFLLQFQDQYHTGEPLIARIEDENVVVLLYRCPNGCSTQMYLDIMLSKPFKDKLAAFNIGKISDINYTRNSVIVEIKMF